MTPDQRRRINAMCGDLSRQVQWTVRINGVDHPTMLHKDDWRHMWAGIQLGDRVAPNPENPERFITLAASSRHLTVAEASEMIDRMSAFGTQYGVDWSDPEWRAQKQEAA